MTVFDEALDTLFADANFGQAATYTPTSGAPVAVTVILYQDGQAVQEPFSQMAEERDLAEIRKSDLTQTPRQGDVITVGSDQWRVDRWPVPNRDSGSADTALTYIMRVRKL